jgi:hypothetical protein
MNIRSRFFNILLRLEAIFCLAFARLVVSWISFRRLVPYLGRPMQESPEEASPLYRGRARRVAWGIYLVKSWLPWENTCLVQAIAAMIMLRRRRQPSTLYLGVSIDHTEFEAHAWLRSGDVVVTGGEEKDKYKVMSSYMKSAG